MIALCLSLNADRPLRISLESKRGTPFGCSANLSLQSGFSKARKNPYAAQLNKQITIPLDEDSIENFKGISEQVGIPYQSLINLYLRD